MPKKSNGKAHDSRISTLLSLNGIFLLIILCAGLWFRRSHTLRDIEICRTKGCTSSSAKILQYLDTTVQPCSDFPKFACGLLDMKPDDSTPTITQLTKVVDRYPRLLIGILNSTTNPNVETKYLRDFMEKCLNGSKSATNKLDCASKAIEVMSVLVDKLYSDRMVANFTENEQSVQDMFNQIKLAMSKEIGASKAAFNKTDKIAKLDKLNVQLIKPGQDAKKLERYTSNLAPITSLDFATLSKNLADKNSQTWQVGVDYFRNLPANGGLLFNDASNNISIPSIIMQAPFFATDSLQAVNYGSLGAMLALKMNSILSLSKNNNDKCFSKQLEKLDVAGKVEELQITSFALDHAYKAYRNYSYEAEKDVRLPGLNRYTPDQIFFLSFANVLCDNSNDSTGGRQRILTSVVNSFEFAHAFNCSSGSPMNPDVKIDAKCRFGQITNHK